MSPSKRSLAAIQYIKTHKRELLERFANDLICPPGKHPISIFMAGSPGAGKTEFSKNFLQKLNFKAVRIDADEIKNFLPIYNGKNAAQVQAASALGVEYLYDYVLRAQKNMILDGTLMSYQKAYINVSRSLKKGRSTEIYYIYQDPFVAWKFTKAREVTDGRHVPKEFFVKALFKAHQNVQYLKLAFGKEIKVNIVLKNLENDLDKVYHNVDEITSYVTINYTPYFLLKNL